MNPILSALNLCNSNNPTSAQIPFTGTADEAKQKVLAMISGMSQQQKAAFAQMLPTIGKVAQAQGVDISALSELQARM